MSIQNEDVIRFVKKYPVGVSCGVVALAFGLATYFRADGLADLQRQLEQRSADGARQQTNIQYAALLSEHLASVTAANAAIADRAIDPRALANNLQFFYRLEADLGVKLLDLRQGTAVPTRKDGVYQAVTYTVALEGRYLQVLEFLRRLESGERFCRLLTVNIVPRRNDGGAASSAEPTLTLSLTLELLGKA
jgi:hypothetical protein